MPTRSDRLRRKIVTRLDLIKGTPGAHCLCSERLDESGKDSHTCFKCGGIGHIGSTPKCPRFYEPAAARVGAQCVLESHADGAEPPEDVYEDEHEMEGDYDGLYGGAQYDPEEDDPNIAPDLAELMGAADGDSESVDAARMEAMRARYFSMRVPDPNEEDTAEAPTASNNTASSEAVFDAVRLIVHLPHNPSGYTDWNAAEEARLVSLAAAADPVEETPALTTLLAEFEERVGSSPLSVLLAIELEAIDALGAEEHARSLWRGLIPLQPQLLVGYSASFLRTTAVNVEKQSTVFSARVAATREYQQDLRSLLSRRLEARDELDRLVNLPMSAESRAPGVLFLADSANQSLCTAIEHHIHHVERDLERMVASQRAIDEELTRRMLEREVYALDGSRWLPSPSSSSRGLLGLAAETEGDDCPSDPSSPSPSDNPQVETTHVVDETEEDSPPSLGLTPPPSYPGTPESSGSDGMWEQVSDHQAAASSATSLPGDGGVVWISDSEEEQSSVPPVPSATTSGAGNSPLALSENDSSAAPQVHLRAQRVGVPGLVERLSNI
ncbi:hypothetical protein DFH09DRAFT_1095348 [Mycena vulgaris]|nr:hypothetical protein DFH09DRAFT_1095348 [Mycena vulgaris]